MGTIHNIEEKKDIAFDMVHRLVSAMEDMETAMHEFVCWMAKATREERAQARIYIERLDFHSSLTNRMIACAERGIPEAKHLYAADEVISAYKITSATTDALMQIADPESEIIIARGPRKVVTVKAAELTRADASKAWSPQSGVLEPSRQLKEASKATKPKAKAVSGKVRIDSIVKDDEGNTIKIEGHKEETGEPVSFSIDAKQIKAMLA